MNVWQLVTNNSTLPVSPANTFWDHLNNLGGGGGGGETIHVFPLPTVYDEETESVVDYETTETLLIEYETQATVEVLTDDEVLQFLEEEIIIYVDS
jgi:hypothetical protein